MSCAELHCRNIPLSTLNVIDEEEPPSYVDVSNMDNNGYQPDINRSNRHLEPDASDKDFEPNSGSPTMFNEGFGNSNTETTNNRTHSGYNYGNTDYVPRRDLSKPAVKHSNGIDNNVFEQHHHIETVISHGATPMSVNGTNHLPLTLPSKVKNNCLKRTCIALFHSFENETYTCMNLWKS